MKQTTLEGTDDRDYEHEIRVNLIKAACSVLEICTGEPTCKVAESAAQFLIREFEKGGAVQT